MFHPDADQKKIIVTLFYLVMVTSILAVVSAADESFSASGLVLKEGVGASEALSFDGQ